MKSLEHPIQHQVLRQVTSRWRNSFVWVVFVGTLLAACQETQSQQKGLPKDVLYGQENVRTLAGALGNSGSTLKCEAQEETETIEQLLSQAKSSQEDLKKKGTEIKKDARGIIVSVSEYKKGNCYKRKCVLSPENVAELERCEKRIEQVNGEYTHALKQVSLENGMPRIQVSDFEAPRNPTQQGTDGTTQHQDQEYPSDDSALIKQIIYMKDCFEKITVPEIKRLIGLLYALAKKLTDKGVPRDIIMAVTGLTEAEINTL